MNRLPYNNHPSRLARMTAFELTDLLEDLAVDYWTFKQERDNTPATGPEWQMNNLRRASENLVKCQQNARIVMKELSSRFDLDEGPMVFNTITGVHDQSLRFSLACLN